MSITDDVTTTATGNDGDGSAPPATARITLPNPVPTMRALPSLLDKYRESKRLGTALGSLSSAAANNLEKIDASYQRTNVRVLLHGFYVDQPFDDWFNGKTGEFYFTSAVTNGVELAAAGSRDAEGGDGVWTKIAGGTWVPIGGYQLWPPTGPDPQATDTITVNFRLLERDDDAVSKRILNGIKPATQMAAAALANGNPAGAAGHEAVIAVFNEVLGELGDDDEVFSGTVALDGPGDHYRVGRFFRIRGPQAHAVFSVVPDPDRIGATTHNSYEQQVSQGQQYEVRVPLDTSGSGAERLVSVFVRTRGPLPSVMNLQNNGESFTVVNTTIRHMVVPAGNDDIVLSGGTPTSMRVRVMVTAIGKDLAAPVRGYDQ